MTALEILRNKLVPIRAQYFPLEKRDDSWERIIERIGIDEIEAISEAMEEYGKQCYIQGSNDYHKVIIDSLPSEKEINIESVNWSEFRWTEIDHLDTEALLNEGFLKGVEYVITKIKGE